MRSEDGGRLEAALTSLAPLIEVPSTPPMAAAVRSRLVPSPRRTHRALRPALAFAAACLVGLIGVLSFSPGSRDAVADFLGVDGIRIGFGGTPDPSLGFEMDLGRSVSAEQADALVGFPVATLRSDAVGSPDAIYFSERPPGGSISLVHKASRSLPAVGDTGVGLVLTQFEGVPDEGFFKKLYEVKEPVEFVTVDGVTGYWVEGVHELRYIDRDGRPRVQAARLSGSALVWEAAGITYRLESGLTKSAAIELANTIQR